MDNFKGYENDNINPQSNSIRMFLCYQSFSFLFFYNIKEFFVSLFYNKSQSFSFMKKKDFFEMYYIT